MNDGHASTFPYKLMNLSLEYVNDCTKYLRIILIPQLKDIGSFNAITLLISYFRKLLLDCCWGVRNLSGECNVYVYSCVRRHLENIILLISFPSLKPSHFLVNYYISYLVLFLNYFLRYNSYLVGSIMINLALKVYHWNFFSVSYYPRLYPGDDFYINLNRKSNGGYWFQTEITARFWMCTGCAYWKALQVTTIYSAGKLKVQHNLRMKCGWLYFWDSRDKPAANFTVAYATNCYNTIVNRAGRYYNSYQLHK